MAFKIFSTSTSTKPFKTLMVGHCGNATVGGNLVTLICFDTGFQAMTTLTTSISFTILEKQLILTQKLMVITVVCASITRSWFETALDYKPRILGPPIEEFPLLVHKMPMILTVLQYKLQWKMGKKIYKPWLIMARVLWAGILFDLDFCQ